MTYRVHNPDLYQEEDWVPAWKVLLAVLFTVVVSALLILWAVQANARSEAVFRPSGVFMEQWLGPRHMVSKVREDLFGERRGATFNGLQRAELDGYGWDDERRGVVHIPIQKAIDLVVAGRRP